MNPFHGNGYAFWSGIGNDIPVFLLGYLPTFLIYYRKNRCHYPKCHRIGHFDFHHYKLCRRHHPKVPQDIALHIAQLHKEGEKVV